ncbi:MAG: hypothetical protein ACYS8I_14465 [Planctomycetota bacterium]|jgi:hypothetical protein
MADFSLQALHDEIEADLESLGYKEAGGAWKGDQVIVDLINAKNYTIDRISIEVGLVRAAITFAAYNNLTIDEQEWIQWMTLGNGSFEVTADMKLQLSGRSLAVNGAGGSGNDNQSFWAVADRSEMVTVLLALIEVPGARAEVLWDEGRTISVGQVGAAANL